MTIEKIDFNSFSSSIENTGIFATEYPLWFFLKSVFTPCSMLTTAKLFYLFSPKKNNATVPGPEWEPITGPILFIIISLTL